jgi:FlaA1/EpsC-like NDP-sugar epimerase
MVAKDSNIDTIKIVPRIYDFHSPRINLKTLEDISIEDLIGRQVVKINYEEIKEFFKDKVILITGAGGSIGSEIAKQVCAFQPKRVILFDIDETDLFNLEIELKGNFPHLFECDRVMEKRDNLRCPPRYLDSRVCFVVGDVNDTTRVNMVFKRFRPDIVFHAAAYKHVPMMECNPTEAVKVNIFGTYTVAKASVEYGVSRFIFISTDKAVRPTSIMGATKRIGEYICKAFNGVEKNNDEADNKHCKTDFISVRFGNVLGSRGSVLPLFLKQLRHGGPLTVTHKDMQRYFMTIPEAVSLVLQASVLGKGGDVMVLDMGKPVSIVSLAEELIRIHGLMPYKDIDIEFIGIRPGENLFEEVLTAEEGAIATRHERIFIAKDSEKYSLADIEVMLDELRSVLKDEAPESYEQIRNLLKKYVKYFK